jgi:hypothetical protein
MNRETRRRFEALRHSEGSVENQVFDDLREGELDRGEFLRRGTLFGLSASTLSTALVAAGEAPVAFARTEARHASGRLRVGCWPPPSGPMETWLSADGGRINVQHVAGEFLTRTLANGRVAKELAVSWKPNHNASKAPSRRRRSAPAAT